MGEVLTQTIEVGEGHLWNRELKRLKGCQSKINGMGMTTMASAERGTEIGFALPVVMGVALLLYHFRLCGIFGHGFVLTGQQIERQEIHRKDHDQKFHGVKLRFLSIACKLGRLFLDNPLAG